jgi:carbon monoxide dehydrogenase subunit G
MKLEGRIAIAAPQDATWALVLDPLTLAGCVPGVKAVRQVDARTFEGSITAAVGPMDGDFAFTSVITRAERPEMDVSIEGIDSVTKSRLEALVTVVMEGSDPAACALAYRAEVKLRGRLAILGEMVLRATASMMINQVTACLRTRLETHAP